MATIVELSLTVLWSVIVVGAVYFIANRVSSSRSTAAMIAGGFAVVFLLGSILHPTGIAQHPASAVVTEGPPTVSTSKTAPVHFEPLTEAQLGNLHAHGTTPTAGIDFVGYSFPGSSDKRHTDNNVFPANSTVVMMGWAADDVAKAPAADIFLLIDGNTRIRDPNLRYGEGRQDVAKAYNLPGFLNSGFRMDVSASAIGKGHHRLQLGIVSAEKNDFRLFPPIVEVTIK